jgi:hypothetical protein
LISGQRHGSLAESGVEEAVRGLSLQQCLRR